MPELQLINRVWRIGQSRPVHVKRFVSEGTVEERMLELRKRTTGLLAEDALAMACAPGDAAAAAGTPAGKGKARAPAASAAAVGVGVCVSSEAQAAAERLDVTRYLLGLSGAEPNEGAPALYTAVLHTRREADQSQSGARGLSCVVSSVCVTVRERNSRSSGTHGA